MGVVDMRNYMLLWACVALRLYQYKPTIRNLLEHISRDHSAYTLLGVKAGVLIERRLSFSGEDRWLCTLLLKNGYKVEYCAASDANTHAPEGDVFFKV